MLLTQNNIVYAHLSRKQRFTCLMCNECQDATSFYIGYRFGQFAGYACDACCKKLVQTPEIERVRPKMSDVVNKEYDFDTHVLNLDIVKQYAYDTTAEEYLYKGVLEMCMRGLILYSRRSKFAKELMMYIRQLRLNLLQLCDRTDKEVDQILLDVLEKCITDGEIVCRKNSAMMRNVYRILETEEAREKLLELEWK